MLQLTTTHSLHYKFFLFVFFQFRYVCPIKVLSLVKPEPLLTQKNINIIYKIMAKHVLKHLFLYQIKIIVIVNML